MQTNEKQVTTASCGHMLANIGVWSRDSKWLVYDKRVRDDHFDGRRIERVHVESGAIEVLYESSNGACCGVVTCSPTEEKVVFIHGPENPTPDWQYNAWHRYGMLVDTRTPGRGRILDARDLAAPLTPGALRGGTHVHVFSGDGGWISFTYEDALLAANSSENSEQHLNLRSVGVSVPAGPVKVGQGHPRNHDGAFFTVLVSATTAAPKPGSDETSKAFEDSWVGANGYLRQDGTRQKRAIAFQGHVRDGEGKALTELFVVDLPDDLTQAAPGRPLEGTLRTRPNPPDGVVQRRLTFTANRKYPGVQGPRHWPRSSPDGSRIAFLMKDDDGVVQLWMVSPIGGEPWQVTRNLWNIASAFSWSPAGNAVAYVMDNSIFVTDTASGESRRITPHSDDQRAPSPYACVFAPDNSRIAYMRASDSRYQLFTVEVPWL